MLDNTGGAAIEPRQKLRVFLSYSRRDEAFANELLAGLELLGFDAYLDKEDIAPGEPWEERLGKLIHDADTVVFVLSQASVKSQHCSWEVNETLKRAKRLLPVVWQTVTDGEVPAPLRRLNYIFFNEGQSFARSLGQLAQALRVNLTWIREHTRLADLAASWVERGRPAGLLLRGTEIADVQSWVARRPDDAPKITPDQHALLDASVAEAEAEFARKAALQWRAKAGTIAAAVIFAIGAGVSTLAFLQARQAKDALEQQNVELKAANLRLERKVSLRVAATGTSPYQVGPNWYQIASDYAGAIALVRTKAGSGNSIASGFVIEGDKLHASFGPKPVFVTVSFAVSSAGPDAGQVPSDARVFPNIVPGSAIATSAEVEAEFPGLDPKNNTIEFGRTLWEESVNGGAGLIVLEIAGPLPFGVKPITRVQATMPADLRLLTDKEAPGVADITYRSPLRELSIVGFGVSVGFSVFLNKLVGKVEHDSIAEGSDLKRTEFAYTHATEAGAAGSPVFDIATGELVAVHQWGGSIAAKFSLGRGIAMVSAKAAIARDLSGGRRPDPAHETESGAGDTR
jgi:hypothetical protein